MLHNARPWAGVPCRNKTSHYRGATHEKIFMFSARKILETSRPSVNYTSSETGNSPRADASATRRTGTRAAENIKCKTQAISILNAGQPTYMIFQLAGSGILTDSTSRDTSRLDTDICCLLDKNGDGIKRQHANNRTKA